MKRDLYLKLLTLTLGIIALLAMGACAAAGSPQPAVNPAQSEPTAIPSPTSVPPMDTTTPTPVPPSESPSPENTPTPEPAEESAEAAQNDEASEGGEAGEAESSEANAQTEGSPVPGNPVQIRIDRIGVVAPFEYVGVTPEGNMAAPDGWDNVAWYEPGSVPGAQGNSVVAGHYDRPGGSRAIFYDLNHLAPGDRITVITEHDEELIFEITEVEIVSVSEAPLEKIFGSTDQHNLNLITCNGVWDSAAGMYDERLIVYSTLVSA